MLDLLSYQTAETGQSGSEIEDDEVLGPLELPVDPVAGLVGWEAV